MQFVKIVPEKKFVKNLLCKSGFTDTVFYLKDGKNLPLKS